MGCWNHTCAITNLPIYAGEKVEVILLKSNNNKDGLSYCYPDAYHTPLSLTFRGEYNDYGAVENCEGVALNTIIESLRENLIEMEEGENKYHDIPAKKDEFDVDKLFELDHESRLFIKNFYKSQYDMRDHVRVQHIVIRKEVYDAIIDNIKLEVWDRDLSETRELGYANLVSQYPTFTQDIKDILSLDDDFRRRSWMMDSQIGKTLVSEMLAYRGQGTYQMHYPIRIVELLFDLLKEDHKNYMFILDNAVRLSLIVQFMQGARKSWVIPSGRGSQDDNTSYQELCAKLTLSSAQVVKNYFEEEDYE